MRSRDGRKRGSTSREPRQPAVVRFYFGDEARGTWQQLEILMRQWRAIEDLATRPGPFIYTATRSSFRAVDLD